MWQLYQMGSKKTPQISFTAQEILQITYLPTYGYQISKLTGTNFMGQTFEMCRIVWRIFKMSQKNLLW